jgi:nitroreductase
MLKLIWQLNWRYAAKRTNREKVPGQKIGIILETTRFKSSSSGLQPSKIIVINNESLNEEIHLKACSQSQIFESSHLLVFANKTSISPQYIDESMALIARARQILLNTPGVN